MTFVFVIGGYAMTSLNQTKCSKEIDLSMTQLASSIEKAGALSIGSYSYTFAPSSCFSNNETKYTLEKEGPVLCSSYCPGSDICYLLKYNNPKDPVSTVRYKCVNVSRYVDFNPGTCMMPPADYKELPVSVSTLFYPADYVFQSMSLTSPTICVYYKE
jgi:hypothetical protein